MSEGIAQRPFVHLHVHSHYSLADGVATVESLVRRAAELEMPAIALTDHNTLAGAVALLEACEAHGIRPIIGCELDVIPWPERGTKSDTGSLILLVESEIGYRNLARLVTLAQSKTLEGRPPHVNHHELAEHSAGLIALVGASSPIRRFLHPPDAAGIESYLTDLVRIFGKENLFFELLPSDSSEVRSFNEYFIQLSEFLDIGIVATNNVHYLWPEDKLAHLFLRRKAPPRTVGRKAAELGSERRHLAGAREMCDRFAFIPQAVENTVGIAGRCRFRPELRRRRLLVHDFARGFNAESYLWDLVFRCATDRYGVLDENFKSRLNEEFDYLCRNGLTNYFLLLWKLAGYLAEKKIPCLVRNGPITSSLLAYILGLTGLDPLAHQLGFEPLLADGAVFPEVTVQVASRHLPDVIEHLRQTYGSEKIARLGSYDYWPKSQLLEELCRWVGLPRQKAEALIASEAISTRSSDSLRWEDLFQNGARTLSPHHPSVLGFLFGRLYPLPREMSSQDTRLVFSGEALSAVVPLAFPGGGEPTTQLDAADCDALGLPRLGLVANRSLDILNEAIGWVRREKDRTFDISEIEDGDPETFRLFGQGRTAGIPGFESVVVRSLLRRERPTDIEKLIQVKTFGSGKRTSTRGTPRGTVIADCRLAYRCAYVKAHYPVSYYTALLTHVCRNRRRFARVLRELAQEGIRLLPPDINLSSYAFTQVGERIRTGLIVVSQMGEKAANEIISVRRGGAFHSLVDFCRRTDPKLVHIRLVENLIKAGAMDSFGLRRSQMLGMLDHIVGRPRPQPVRRVSSVQMEFEFPAIVEEEEPDEIEPPDLPELPLHLKLQYELQAANHTISADLLEPFADLLAKCRIGRPPVQISSRLEGRDLYIAGTVNQIERASPADPDGIGAWLDFEGVLVAVPQPLLETHERVLRSSEPLMIGGKAVCRSGECYLRAHTITTLIKIHQQAAQAKRVVLDLAEENKRTVRTLRQICGQFPGETQVVAVHYEAIGRLGLKKLESMRVIVCPPLLNGLRKVLGPERVRVIGYGED